MGACKGSHGLCPIRTGERRDTTSHRRLSPLVASRLERCWARTSLEDSHAHGVPDLPLSERAIVAHFSKEDLLAEASRVDRGFGLHIFAEMLRSLARFSDADLPAPGARIASMRDFLATWADRLDT
jgi:hypothetical protein